MKELPIKYHIEIYEKSFKNDPSASWATSSPLPALAIGDAFEIATFDRWNNPPGDGEELRIADMQHIFWEIGDSHIGYKVLVCLKVVPMK